MIRAADLGNQGGDRRILITVTADPRCRVEVAGLKDLIRLVVAVRASTERMSVKRSSRAACFGKCSQMLTPGSRVGMTENGPRFSRVARV